MWWMFLSNINLLTCLLVVVESEKESNAENQERNQVYKHLVSRFVFCGFSRRFFLPRRNILRRHRNRWLVNVTDTIFLHRFFCFIAMIHIVEISRRVLSFFSKLSINSHSYVNQKKWKKRIKPIIICTYRWRRVEHCHRQDVRQWNCWCHKPVDTLVLDSYTVED